MIYNLAEKQEYFEPLIDLLYKEWHIYYAKYGYNTKEKVNNFYKTAIDHIYIAILNNRIIGCYSLTRNYITDVFVIPEYRKQGIGYELMRDVIYRSLYWPYVYLHCEGHNVEFYRKFGFSIVGYKKDGNICMIKLNYIMIVCYITIIFLLIMLIIKRYVIDRKI